MYFLSDWEGFKCVLGFGCYFLGERILLKIFKEKDMFICIILESFFDSKIKDVY